MSDTLDLLETLNLLEITSRQGEDPKITSVTIRELNKVLKPECCTTIKELIISWRAKKQNLGDGGSSNGTNPLGTASVFNWGAWRLATAAHSSFVHNCSW